MSSCDFCKFTDWCLSKAEDMNWCFNKPLLNNAYEQGRADEQLKSIEDAKQQATEYLDALDKAKKEAYQQGAREFAEWLQYGRHDFCVVDYDNRLETVPFEIILAEWQKEENNITTAR